ncbi:hypothetical protein [Streptomyces sp. NPDC058579]|uniref:hypothetical protein n=1 Tax=Streptomyces sp. NPDC058579 TaxID=3346548 RepID=UPI0036507E37
MAAGLLTSAVCQGCAMLPGRLGILTAAALIGEGAGMITSLGFAARALIFAIGPVFAGRCRTAPAQARDLQA